MCFYEEIRKMSILFGLNRISHPIIMLFTYNTIYCIPWTPIIKNYQLKKKKKKYVYILPQPKDVKIPLAHSHLRVNFKLGGVRFSEFLHFYFIFIIKMKNLDHKGD